MECYSPAPQVVQARLIYIDIQALGGGGTPRKTG